MDPALFQPPEWATCVVCNYRQNGPPPVTEQLFAGASTHLYWSVANLGTVTVMQPMKFRFFLDGVQIGGYWFDPATLVPPGLASSMYASLTYPVTVALPGEHTITVVFVPTAQVPDDNLGNNSCSFTGTWSVASPSPTPSAPLETRGETGAPAAVAGPR